MFLFSTKRLTLVLFLAAASHVAVAGQAQTLKVSVSIAKPAPGQSVGITVRSAGGKKVAATLMRPGIGPELLPLKATAEKDVYTSAVKIDEGSPGGLYLVYAWAGSRTHPTAVAKASFRTGNIVADFYVANYTDQRAVAADIANYLKDFRSLGGNLLVAHNLIVPAGAFYPSRIAKTSVRPGAANDVVEQILTQADRQGIGVLLSANWDATRTSPYKDRMKEIKAIISELYALYRHHPSLAGFYSWQEGSGTYYAPYIREFSEHVKSLDKGLLTACAPHIDDPLLASYLSVIEELDILIYQGAVMGSYRTDNRKKYPLRRVRDFASLGAGAKRLQGKITLTHVELFGYLEKRRSPDHAAASYDDIFGQILSAATVTDTDGISLFTHHAIVYEPLKKFEDVQKSRQAVADGLKAYRLITSKVSNGRNPIALYAPYSDFVVERWSEYFLPALDAFRAVGVPVDVLPYAPRMDESVYPYYPIHHNNEVLERLLKEGTVLVLANVSGFQQTDSDLIKAFIERGGVVVAFGPQIPMGRSYERTEMFGIDEPGKPSTHSKIVVTGPAGGRVKAGDSFARTLSDFPAWTAGSAKVVAVFEDDSPAVTINKYGKGLAIAILPPAEASVQTFPELVRDVLRYAVSSSGHSLPVDVLGGNEKTDIAVRRIENGFCVAVVNHDGADLEVTLRPATSVIGEASEWRDLVTGRKLPNGAADLSMKLRIPGGGFRAVEYATSAAHRR